MFGKRKRAEAIAQAEVDFWVATDQMLAKFLDLARTYRGDRDPVPGFLLKPDEKGIFSHDDVALMELKHAAGHFEGGSHGVSLRIAKGVRYRVGQTRGTYVPGPESPTAIDTGRVLVTTSRIAFAGDRQAREWAFDKLIAYSHDVEVGWTALQVSNRQKTSGIGYGSMIAPLMQFAIDPALAIYSGEVEQFAAQIEAEYAEHQISRPPGLALG
jgi:hypothetical protein